MPNEVNIRNKRASFDYEFLEEYNAGIVLTGTEIKSIRAGKASLVDSYCFFNRGELWVKGMHIAEYKLGTYYNHEEKRERKLLLTHKELIKLQRKVKESGLTIVPVKVFLNEKGYAKEPDDQVPGSENLRTHQQPYHHTRLPSLLWFRPAYR